MADMVRDDDSAAMGGKGKGQEKFWEDYDKMTVGGILAVVVKEGSQEFRDKVLERERKGKKRDGIIVALVNWNS